MLARSCRPESRPAPRRHRELPEIDEVDEGDPLGACGNSDNTSEPHMHIHHQRQDPQVFLCPLPKGCRSASATTTVPPCPRADSRWTPPETSS